MKSDVRFGTGKVEKNFDIESVQEAGDGGDGGVVNVEDLMIAA